MLHICIVWSVNSTPNKETTWNLVRYATLPPPARGEKRRLCSLQGTANTESQSKQDLFSRSVKMHAGTQVDWLKQCGMLSFFSLLLQAIVLLFLKRIRDLWFKLLGELPERVCGSIWSWMLGNATLGLHGYCYCWTSVQTPSAGVCRGSVMEQSFASR